MDWLVLSPESLYMVGFYFLLWFLEGFFLFDLSISSPVLDQI